LFGIKHGRFEPIFETLAVDVLDTDISVIISNAKLVDSISAAKRKFQIEIKISVIYAVVWRKIFKQHISSLDQNYYKSL
jgi:hypothetical protein